MGLFDDAEKLAGKAVGDSEVSDLTGDAEKLVDNETGNKFDSEIQDGGNALDHEVGQELPNL